MRLVRKHLVRLLSGLFFCGLFSYGFFEPRTAPGHLTFHTFYLFPPTRPAFLQLYSDILRRTEGGYLPSGIDEFLASRLWDEQGGREWRGILDFYISQGPGRWGRACGGLHETLKPRLIQQLLGSMATDGPQSQTSKLIFIEYLRLDGALHKGSMSVWHWDEEQRRGIYDMNKLRQARAAFETWFASSSQWQDLRRRDPLAGTDIRITGIQ